jgi:TolA-binding protein
MTDEEYENNYQYGYNLALNRQFKEAIQVFENLIAVNSNHKLADNAQYWIGECYYALGDYRTAIISFEKVFTFSQSNKNDYAQYKLGLCYFNLNDRQRAKEEFQSLIDNYQNPMLTGKAEEYLAKL